MAASDNLHPDQFPVDYGEQMTATYHDHAKQQAAIQHFDSLPNDRHVYVYHGTSPEGAANLLHNRTVLAGATRSTGDNAGTRTGWNSGLYVAPTYKDAANYGSEVLRMRVPKGSLTASDEMGAYRDPNVSVGRAFMNTSAGAVIPPGHSFDEIGHAPLPDHMSPQQFR